MFTSCKYAEALKCKGCIFAYHKECKRFVTARAKDLSRDLLPFVLSSKVKISSGVTWSRDKNRAKSVALRYAMKLNSPIKKYTFSQVVSLALSNEPVEAQVIYIEYQTKLSGDTEKLKGVLSSFIENCTLRGAMVSIFVSPSIPFNLEYDKV